MKKKEKLKSTVKLNSERNLLNMVQPEPPLILGNIVNTNPSAFMPQNQQR
jgi:hypothetical protein